MMQYLGIFQLLVGTLFVWVFTDQTDLTIATLAAICACACYASGIVALYLHGKGE